LGTTLSRASLLKRGAFIFYTPGGERRKSISADLQKKKGGSRGERKTTGLFGEKIIFRLGSGGSVDLVNMK